MKNHSNEIFDSAHHYKTHAAGKNSDAAAFRVRKFGIDFFHFLLATPSASDPEKVAGFLKNNKNI